jgi:serine/threonine-protein kinase PknG
MLAALESAPRSPELAYQLARSWIDAGDFDKAEAELDSPEAHAGGWRVAWWRGVLHLANDRPEGACAFFGAVAAELPGELAPRLALAVALELSAAGPGYYGIVSATDPSYASAAFGLSRVRLALGDRAGAVEALRRISTFSSSHLAAQIGLCQLQCADVDGSAPTLVDLTGASAVLGKLAVEPSVRLPLVRDLHRQALRLLEDGDVAADAGIVLAGNPFDEVAQRNGMEQTLRSLAKLAPTDKERCQLVDQANHFRSRTFT